MINPFLQLILRNVFNRSKRNQNPVFSRFLLTFNTGYLHLKTKI
ncbi:hypothetical protein PPHE_a0032 [Pseudoalteromonas phenolica O-BC30]|nr:hypothetical protein [Pseudoalteromonas phenolica O-BC30]